ncbi:hypothetical protein WME97_21315 [Sorangium sp. So ce367]|uniref:hypothetical protein n=1 Tax=Sorangium sp. So ce367 TaxID=3133305 RepID=UPI003F5F9091
MQVKIVVIDFEIPARIKRRALTVGIPLAILAGAGAVAYASVPHTWKSGEVLNAADLNESFGTLDKRVATLEADPTYLVADSSETEVGEVSQDLLYQSISLDLTPGTWLVEGFATLSTTMSPDQVQLSLWDDTNDAEVPQSRSPIHWTASSDYGAVAAVTSSAITVTANTKIRLKAHRNGVSIIWFGPSNAALELPPGHRLTALRLK